MSNSKSAKHPPDAPLDRLDTRASLVYAYAHPGLIFVVYSGRFGHLVQDPVLELSRLLVVTIALQIAYCAICLPAAGSSSVTEKLKPGQKRRNVSQSSVVATKLPSAIIALLLAVILAVPILTTLLILLGAPLTSHFAHTALLAAHISILTILPLFYVHGVDGATWRSIMSCSLPVDEVFGATLGCALGAWVGAVPIPLDWDRDWQKWPCTVLVGAIAGWTLGKILGGTLFKGKKLDLE